MSDDPGRSPKRGLAKLHTAAESDDVASILAEARHSTQMKEGPTAPVLETVATAIKAIEQQQQQGGAETEAKAPAPQSEESGTGTAAPERGLTSGRGRDEVLEQALGLAPPFPHEQRFRDAEHAGKAIPSTFTLDAQMQKGGNEGGTGDSLEVLVADAD